MSTGGDGFRDWPGEGSDDTNGFGEGSARSLASHEIFLADPTGRAIDIVHGEVVQTESAGPSPHASEPSAPSPRRRLFGARGSARPSAAVIVLLSISALAMWCLMFAAVLSPVQAHRSQRNLYAQIRSQIALQTVPVGGSIEPGTPVALLQIPDIGVHNAVIVEGTSAGDLEDGPGHRRDTPLPGQIGTSVLMGRSLLFGGPFERIHDLPTGASVVVTTGQGVFHYAVDRVRRPGDPGPSELVEPAGRLTMITSESIGGGFGSERRTVYVDATLLDPAQPASVGRPVSVDESEASLRGDDGALVDLTIWLIAIVAAVVAADWLQARWGRRQAFIVAVPVVVALLWLSAESAAQLLPNLM